MQNKNIILASDESIGSPEKWTDILRVGDWGTSYKQFAITKKDLRKIVENFKSNVLGLDEGEVQFNYSHNSFAEAAGWIHDLRIKGKVLQAKVRWTKKAMERIADEEYKYVSAEINLEYKDAESDQKFGITLTGAALTNIPFVRGMKAVALSNDGEDRNSFYLLTKNNKMEKFKELLSDVAEQTTLSALDFAKVKGAHLMLSEEEQAETQEEVDNLETKVTPEEVAEAETEVVEEETTEEVAETTETELSETTSVDLSEVQAQLHAANEQIAALQLASRTKDLSEKVDALVLSGKLLDKNREAMVNTLIELSDEQQSAMLQILDSQNPVVPVGEEVGLSSTDMSKKASEVSDEDIQARVKELQAGGMALNAAVSKAVAELSFDDN